MGKIQCMVFLAVLGMAVPSFAVEVINIDINGYGDDAAYTGTAAYDDGINVWQAYYGGWGEPMGSPRSKNLTTAYDPAHPAGTYADQVWIGDAGAGHTYETGSGLMDDGFVRDPLAAKDPNILLFGSGAYGGTFDLYVYGREAGSFTVITDNLTAVQSVTGGVAEGAFVEGGNYVIFPAIEISDPNGCQILYTNTINAIQLVSLKQPVAVVDGTVIDAQGYDVAYDTNARTGEITFYGPDLGDYVHYLDTGEYMDYDITVDAAAEGQYALLGKVVTRWGLAGMNILLDGKPMGEMTAAQTSNDTVVDTNALTINLFEGRHTLRWTTPSQIYFDIVSFSFTRLGDITLNNCEDVYTFGLNLAGDLNGDCRVDMSDLAMMAVDWAQSNNPQ